MSRALIGGVVAVLILAFTGVAYVATSSKLEDRIRKDVEVRVAKAHELLIQNANLEMLGFQKRAESLAREPAFIKALRAEKGPDPAVVERAFGRFRAGLDAAEPRPDILAVVDAKGLLVALQSGDTPVLNPLEDTYLEKGVLKYRAIGLALKERVITSEVWDYETTGPMKAAVAPIVDGDMDETMGALIIAYAITSTEAERQQKLLGADVAFFYNKSVQATSFARGRGDDTEKQSAIGKPLFEGGLAAAALEGESGLSDLETVSIDGDEYIATAGRLPRFSSKPFPDDYPGVLAGAMVAMSVTDAMAPVASVKMNVLVLGVGALVIALLAMMVTAKRILGPIEEIEIGVNNIINGNIDQTFSPAGSDLDGLANALNVMLSRLLGRPEPGEEEFDDQGNIIQSATLDVSMEGMSPKEAEAVALAQEDESDYYNRIFHEYVAARQAANLSIEGLNIESFVAKLRLNEVNLKSKYECRAVRFKVVAGNGKVTLKPVPVV